MSYKHLYAVPASKFQEFLNQNDAKFPNVKTLSVDQLNINEAEKINANYSKKEKVDSTVPDNVKSMDIENDVPVSTPDVNVNVNNKLMDNQSEGTKLGVNENLKQEDNIDHWTKAEPNPNYKPYQEYFEPSTKSDSPLGFTERNDIRASLNKSDVENTIREAEEGATDSNWLYKIGDDDVQNREVINPSINLENVPMHAQLAATGRNIAELQNKQQLEKGKQVTPPSNKHLAPAVKQELFTLSPKVGRTVRNRASQLREAAAASKKKEDDVRKRRTTFTRTGTTDKKQILSKQEKVRNIYKAT